MKRGQILVIGVVLALVFGAAAAWFQWGLDGIPALEAMDEIDRRLEPGPMTEAVRERLAQFEAIPAAGLLAPERMDELRDGLAGLEEALAEIEAAGTESAKKSKTRTFESLRIPVTVDLKMTAEGLGFVRGLYRFVFVALFLAGVITALGWPGIAALVNLVAACAGAIGLFIDTNLGYPVFALAFLLLALLFGLRMSRLPGNNPLITNMEKRLASTSKEGQRRIYRRDIGIGLGSLILGAILSIVVSMLVPYVAVGFVGLMAYGVLRFGISFGVWLRHRFA